MQDSKDIAWSREYDSSGEEDAGEKKNKEMQPANDSDPDGWQQYRRWISKAPTPRGRRTGLYPSLYSWKGYRNWTEQIKRNWRDS